MGTESSSCVKFTMGVLRMGREGRAILSSQAVWDVLRREKGVESLSISSPIICSLRMREGRGDGWEIGKSINSGRQERVNLSS